MNGSDTTFVPAETAGIPLAPVTVSNNTDVRDAAPEAVITGMSAERRLAFEQMCIRLDAVRAIRKTR